MIVLFLGGSLLVFKQVVDKYIVDRLILALVITIESALSFSSGFRIGLKSITNYT